MFMMKNLSSILARSPSLNDIQEWLSSSLEIIIIIMVFGKYMHIVLIILGQSVVVVVHWHSGMVFDKLSSCHMWLIATLKQELNAIIKGPIVPLSYGLLIKLVWTINHHKKPILYWYQLLSAEAQVHKHTHTAENINTQGCILICGVFIDSSTLK